MSAHRQAVIDYFDHTQNDYRLLWGIDRHLGLHCGFFDHLRRCHDDAVLHMNGVLAMVGKVGAGNRVLDAGCGIGGSAIWLAENVGASVVGVNINEKQIQQAQTLVRERRLEERIQLQVADFCDTGLADASFDVVWALESACYAENKPAFLAEAYRLLKPGGRLVVADGFLNREDLSSGERRIVERWQGGWAIPNTSSVAQFKRWLQDAGFHGIRHQDITNHVVPSSRRIYVAAVLFYPLGIMLHALGLRTMIQTRGIASGYYQYHARRRGLGVYVVFRAEK